MTPRGPFTATFGKYEQTLVRESLETALYALQQALASAPWRIENASKQILVSSTDGFSPDLNLSLLARQILSNLLPYASPHRSTIGDIDICTDAYSSMDDGETWTKLLDTPDRAARPNGVPHPRAKGLTSPVTFDWIARPLSSPTADLAVDIIIRHARGHLRINSRFLELRPASKPERWDLVILGTLPDGMPSKVSKGVYVSNLRADEAQAAQNIGVRVKETRDPNRPGSLGSSPP